MKNKRVVIEDTSSEEGVEVTVKELTLEAMLVYPYNSLIHESVYEMLLDKVNDIPLNDLKQFLDNY